MDHKHVMVELHFEYAFTIFTLMTSEPSPTYARDAYHLMVAVLV